MLPFVVVSLMLIVIALITWDASRKRSGSGSSDASGFVGDGGGGEDHSGDGGSSSGGGDGGGGDGGGGE